MNADSHLLSAQRQCMSISNKNTSVRPRCLTLLRMAVSEYLLFMFVTAQSSFAAGQTEYI